MLDIYDCCVAWLLLHPLLYIYVFIAGQYYPDRAVQRELDALLVFCKYKNLGCDWKGILKDWEGHFTESCEFKGVSCPFSGCGQMLLASKLEQHKQECSYRPTECEYCNLQLKFHELEVFMCADLILSLGKRFRYPRSTLETSWGVFQVSSALQQRGMWEGSTSRTGRSVMVVVVWWFTNIICSNNVCDVADVWAHTSQLQYWGLPKLPTTGMPFTASLSAELGVYFAEKARGVPQGLSPNHVAAIGIFVYSPYCFYVFVLRNEYYDTLLRYTVARE